jgi:hypothetical protein
MSEDVSSARIAMMAVAARVPLAPEACARVARAVSPTIERLSAVQLPLAFETEPSTFTVVQRRELT